MSTVRFALLNSAKRNYISNRKGFPRLPGQAGLQLSLAIKESVLQNSQTLSNSTNSKNNFMQTTIFQNFTKVVEQIDILSALHRIRDGLYRTKIYQLRALVILGKADEYTAQKKSLPAFTPSASFIGGRKMQFLESYSGIIVLDLDKLTPEQISNAQVKLAQLNETFAYFISPSGNGIKILVRVDTDQQQHLQAFNQVKSFYETILGLQIDPSGSDLTRLCFFSSDPEIYINTYSKVFVTSSTAQTGIERYVTPSSPTGRIEGPVTPSSPLGRIEEQIEAVIQQIEQHQIDITGSYRDWLIICFALIDALGTNAREPFHRISRFHSKYNAKACDDQFDKCLNSPNTGATIKSFFFYAQNHGINISKLPVGLSLTQNTTFVTPSSPSGRIEEPVTPSSPSGRIEEPVTPSKPSGCIEEPINSITPNSQPFYTNITPSSLGAPPTRPLGIDLITPPSEITGHQSDKIPKPKKGSRNKFHLVRDYLTDNYDIRYNSVSTNFEYKEKDQSVYEPMNENDIFIKMQLDGLSFSLTNLVAFLKSSMVSKYNPFTRYFESLPKWDGVTDHILELASFVILKPEVRQRFDTHFKKWMVRVVKCAMLDAYFNKQAFILVHDKQNSGKSTFCRFLCPPLLKNYIAENLSIDKDSRILLTTNLLINLDELSTLSKVEINSLKSLFSKDKINDRLPYDRKNSIIPRRASFIGSTNQAEFLNDESGSVRWLCFVIESINWAYSQKINIDKVWAQAFHLFKTNFPSDLTAEEIKENEEYNRQFNITTSEFELIHKFFSPATKESHDFFMSATEILLYLSEQTCSRIKLNAINIGKALKMLSFTREKKYPEKSYAYYVFKKNI